MMQVNVTASGTGTAPSETHSEAEAHDAKLQIFANPQGPQSPLRRASIDSIRSQESNVSQDISHASKVCV